MALHTDSENLFVRTPDLSFQIFLLQRFTLVDNGFAFAKAELNFGVPLGEVNLQRDDRHTLRVDLAGETVDFFLVEQQAAGAEWVDVVAITEFVGIDVGVVQPALAALNAGEGFVNGSAGVAEGFDLRALQFDARFVRLGDEIVATGFVVENL